MAINWGMAGQNNNALAYFQMGQQLGQQVIDKRINSAAARFMQGDQNAIADVAKYDAGLGMQLQQRQAQAQKVQQETRRAKVEDVARLFKGVTPENYGQRIAAARQLGVDVSEVPTTFDPNWVATNAALYDALSGKDDELSGIARELVNAGYQPNTPQFKEAMVGVINNKYAAEYVDDQGNTRRRSALNIAPGTPAQQSPQSVPAQEPITFDMFMSAKQGLGPQGSLEWITSNNIPVKVATPQQARQLPRGTRIILPDGSEGVVP